MRLLIAEDDRDLSKALVTILEKNHYSADAVYNGKDAVAYIREGNYDGAVFDIMMPEMDGIEALIYIRREGYSLPVLLLTAKSEVEDKVTGLDAGADDYLAKPFAVAELLARIRAMLRRKEDYQPDIQKYNEILLDKGTFELKYEEKKVRLSGREFQMFEMLISAPETIVPAERFMEQVWGWDSEVEVSIVWVYISNLRKKLLEMGAPVEIRGVRGVGYCLEKKHD